MLNNILQFLNDNIGFVTLIAASFAFLVYWKQREDEKRKSARIILQEIRRAEDIISDYKEHGEYKFTKKIIATNSWARNIHHFVGDLDADELDKISNLYSMGEYLDSIITKVSDYNFNKRIEDFERDLGETLKSLQAQQQVIQNQSPLPQVSQITGQNIPMQNIGVKINLPIALRSPWKDLLDEVTLKCEPIYHSTIVNKLKKIAKLK